MRAPIIAIDRIYCVNSLGEVVRVEYDVTERDDYGTYRCTGIPEEIGRKLKVGTMFNMPNGTEYEL